MYFPEMNKKIDSRHIAFHVLVAIYFIWAIIFSALIGMTIANFFSKVSASIVPMLETWLLLNFVMGSVLFMVIKLFRQKVVIMKAIRWSYFTLAITAIVIVIIART